MNYIYVLMIVSLSTFFFKIEKLYAHKVNKNEINSIIESFIQNNPEVIENALKKIKSIRNYEKIQKNLAYLSKIPNPRLSRKNSDVIIYEFFDYNCGYCKLVMQSLFNVYRRDNRVEIVFVEFPILSKDSLTASLTALASRNQNKYFELHSSLMKHKGKIDENIVLSFANELNIDIEKLKKHIADKSLMNIINGNRQIANELNIQGTPAFIIGNKIYPGAMSEDEIIEAINVERKNK